MTSADIRLSVVIPCYNAAETIPFQLEALAGQHWSHPWEVVISDNGSTDESVAVVNRYRDRLPNLRVVDASDRRGEAHARNVGVNAAHGEAIAFCDADDEVAPGWVAGMGQALSRHDFVACRIDVQKLNAPWTPGLPRGPQDDDVQKLWYPPYLLHAGGGTLGFKRSLCHGIGGFDESLPVLPDTDFCLRMQLAGVQLRFVPEAVVHVRYRRTYGGLFRQARRWAYYNVLMFKRYRPKPATRELWRWKKYLSEWTQLILRFPQTHTKRGRAAWVKDLGWYLGQLAGCLKHGVPPIPFE
jgi:glycosyltransferase involved in cell wall biosynthesis